MVNELLSIGIFWHFDEIFLTANVDVDLELYLLFRHFIIGIVYHSLDKSKIKICISMRKGSR